MWRTQKYWDTYVKNTEILIIYVKNTKIFGYVMWGTMKYWEMYDADLDVHDCPRHERCEQTKWLSLMFDYMQCLKTYLINTTYWRSVMLPNTSFYTINLNRFNKIQGGSMRTVKKMDFMQITMATGWMSSCLIIYYFSIYMLPPSSTIYPISTHIHNISQNLFLAIVMTQI